MAGRENCVWKITADVVGGRCVMCDPHVYFVMFYAILGWSLKFLNFSLPPYVVNKIKNVDIVLQWNPFLLIHDGMTIVLVFATHIFHSVFTVALACGFNPQLCSNAKLEAWSSSSNVYQCLPQGTGVGVIRERWSKGEKNGSERCHGSSSPCRSKMKGNWGG